MVSVWQVQVIQQPLQNPTYLQQLYNTQGQLLMPSNLQLHPAGMNPSSIHVSAFRFSNGHALRASQNSSDFVI
jgi:polyhomeotic-like protein 1